MPDLMESTAIGAAPSVSKLDDQRERLRPEPQVSAVSGRYFLQQLVTSTPLVAADVLTLAIIYWAVSCVPGLSNGLMLLDLLPYLTVAMTVIYAFAGLYPAVGVHPAEELRLCGISTSAIAITCLCLVLASTDGTVGLVLAVVAVWILMFGAIPLTRYIVRQLAARFDCWAQPVLIFASVHEGATLVREMQAGRSCGLRPLGIIADPTSQWHDGDAMVDKDLDFWIGTLEEAASIAESNGVYWAIICSPGEETGAGQLNIEDYLTNIPHRLYSFEEQHQDGQPNSFMESASYLS